MAAGIDLLAAKIVLQLRGDMPKMEITLEAAIPFLFQSKRWKEETKREYESYFRSAIKCLILPMRSL